MYKKLQHSKFASFNPELVSNIRTNCLTWIINQSSTRSGYTNVNLLKHKMSIARKICVFLLLVSLAMATRPRYGRYAGTNELLDSNDLTPPQDPAINTFPKAPVVPLIPTCVRFGYFRDPFNCGKFYYCEHSEAIPSTFWCQHGLIFNEQTEKCDDPYFVNC